jgi:uncharacterized RDD family membrane protein YckC
MDTGVVFERIAAQIIDNIAIIIAGLIPLVIFIGIGLGLESVNETISGLSVITGFLLLACISLSYEPLLEYKWNGQTLGKKAVDIRVRKEDGSRIGKREAVLRNLPVIGYLIPYFGIIAYPIALITIGVSDKRQRIFDKAADTIVVKDEQ